MSGPVFSCHSCFDAEGTVRRHAVPDLEPTPEFVTNYLGVRIDPKFFPEYLPRLAGTVEPPPVPANWHADVAEWAAALRAVELATDTFTVVELGCGWGCWINNTGTVARRAGLAVRLIGVEADTAHAAFAAEACRTNGFAEGELTVHQGIAAATAGFALFPRHDVGGTSYGLEPLFGLGDDDRRERMATGRYHEYPMIPLERMVEGGGQIDLLHIDIQGGEYDLVHGSVEFLNRGVAYIVIGTHSRQIEGRLFDTLLAAGWVLEIERPAILRMDAGGPIILIDGVQGWRNPRLRP